MNVVPIRERAVQPGQTAIKSCIQILDQIAQQIMKVV